MLYTLCFAFFSDPSDPIAWCHPANAAQVVAASHACRDSRDPLSVCKVISETGGNGVTFWMATKWMGG